ncbi:MAG TPA: DUF1207 domain-containing protein [Bacteroidota bacterium]|nr:DUF1207 domain-containing protein [Bacteroidota bacterium]
MKYLFSLLVLITAAGSAGDFSLVPGGLLFRPLAANTFEPRVGFVAQSSANKLRLDIGNSIDLIQYAADSVVVTMGADFFTYTYLRGEQNFHFPVDASDYFFGFNFNAARSTDAGRVSARLRLSHISAHFVDGHYSNATGQWKDSRPPQVYSREFLDLTAAFEPAALHGSTRVYAGAVYLYHVDPKWLPKTSALLGAEYHYGLAGSLNLFGAYQASFMKVRESKTRHQLNAGIKLGAWNGRGIELYGTYFSGYSIHGEYYDVQEEYTGFGMNIDF